MAKLHKSQQHQTNSLLDHIEGQVEAFFDQQFDPLQELKNQYKRMGKDWKKANIEESRITKDFDTLYTSHLFDLAEWWRNVGKKTFNFIAIAVPSIMAMPASNAHQERTFSICTHFNDELRNRLRDDRFEQSILIAVNKRMSSIEIPTEEEAAAIIADTVTMIEKENADDFETVLESFGIEDIATSSFQGDASADLATPRRLTY